VFALERQRVAHDFLQPLFEDARQAGSSDQLRMAWMPPAISTPRSRIAARISPLKCSPGGGAALPVTDVGGSDRSNR